MKSDISTGFWTGKSILSWGTEYDEATSKLEVIRRSPPPWCRCSVESKESYGFDTLTAEFAAPRPDRPILQAMYEINAAGAQMEQFENCNFFTDQISEWLGPPIKKENHKLMMGQAYWSSGVKFSAGWTRPGVSLALSMYGAPRTVANGLAVGSLWLDWKDEKKAAAPYLPELTESENRLKQVADRLSIITILPLEEKPRPFGTQPGERGEIDPEIRRSRIALRKSNVLPTPSEIQSRFAYTEVMLWKSASGSEWGFSTCSDTVVLFGQEPKIKWVNLLPAKSSGSTTIEIGDLSLTGSCNSPKMLSIVTALREIPNIIIDYEEYPDC